MKRLLIVMLVFSAGLTVGADEVKEPNMVFILTDDMGYGDLGCFGSTNNRTPVLDQMAEEGMRFTSFNTHAICCPTRTAIMTGSYAMRVAEVDNTKRHHPYVHPNEIMIPQLLKSLGYATAVIGKWDMNGHRKDFKPEVKPRDFGFDTYYGRPGGCEGLSYDNDDEIDKIPLSLLTQMYTDRAIQFIDQHKDKPFFIYLAHGMPHEPLDASPQFKGKSANGIYGDVIEELDWNVGRILKRLKELNLDKKTIVIFCSDNGPWPYWTGPEESGVAGPLRGQKTETWEGGVRTPFIVRAPGMVPAGKICDGMIGDVDMLPTLAAFAGANVPKDRIIDGKNLKPLMTGLTDVSPVTTRYFYYDTHLQAVRLDKWKLILERPVRPPWLHDKGLKKKYRGRDVEAIPVPQLYNLEDDIGETKDLASQHPEVVERLLKLAAVAREDIGDYDRVGKGARFYDKKKPQRPDASKWID